jgi:hypothetical protein
MANLTRIILPGLKRLPKDKRDLTVGSIFGYPKLEEVPNEDFLLHSTIKDQGFLYACSGYAGATVIEPAEGRMINGDSLYGWAKKLEGDMEKGADLRTICKVLTKIGAIEQSEWKENLDEDGIKRWWEWSDKYEDLAIKHRQKAYFAVDGRYDFFDNIRLNLWRFIGNGRGVLTGTQWYQDWTSQKEINKISGYSAGGHALGFMGQKIIKGVPYLVAQNSYGLGLGDNGYYYFSREVVNKCFPAYGAFMFIDYPEDELRKLIDAKQMTLMKKLIGYLNELIALLAKKKV